MLGDPGKCEDATPHQHHDGGCSRRDDLFDESLLEARQTQIRRIAELSRGVLRKETRSPAHADDRDLTRLCRLDGDEPSSRLDVVPLFETVEDLQSSADNLRALMAVQPTPGRWRHAAASR